jgi:ABC-type uncharacterized transport system auxiliary subunit
MKNTQAALVSLIFAGALLAGCGATRPSHYYHLNALQDTPASASDAARFPVTLLVSPFQASHLYREDRIVYSTQHEEMGLYQYERWAEPPTEMFDEILVRRLRHSGRYREVFSLRSSARGEYILRGHLYDLKEVMTGNGLVGRVTLEVELVDSKSKSTLWTHDYTHDESVPSKDVASVVAALNRNVQAGVSDLCSSLEQYFSTHPPKPADTTTSSN